MAWTGWNYRKFDGWLGTLPVIKQARSVTDPASDGNVTRGDALWAGADVAFAVVPGLGLTAKGAEKSVIGLKALWTATKTGLRSGPGKILATSGAVGGGGIVALTGLGYGAKSFGQNAGDGFEAAASQAGEGLGEGLRNLGDGIARGAVGLALGTAAVVGTVVAVRAFSGRRPTKGR